MFGIISLSYSYPFEREREREVVVVEVCIRDVVVEGRGGGIICLFFGLLPCLAFTATISPWVEVFIVCEKMDSPPTLPSQHIILSPFLSLFLINHHFLLFLSLCVCVCVCVVKKQ